MGLATVRIGFAVVALVSVLAAPTSWACSKRLVINQASWLPYMYRDEAGNLAGLDYELVKGILGRAGCDYVFVEYPSKRALVGVERGEIDLVAGASITPERRTYGRFSRSYREERIVLMVRAGERRAYPGTSLAELMARHDLVLGAINGGYYGDEYGQLDRTALVSSGQLVLMPDNERLLNLLALGRIDAIAGDAASLYMTAEKLGVRDQVTLHDHVLSQDVVHLLLSKRSTTPSDLALIDAAIESYISSNDYLDLLARYGFDVATIRLQGRAFHTGGDTSAYRR